MTILTSLLSLISFLMLPLSVHADFIGFADYQAFLQEANISTSYNFAHDNNRIADTINGITFADVQSGTITPSLENNQGYQVFFAQDGFVVSALAPDGSSPSGIPNFTRDDSMSLLIGAISVSPGELLVSDRSLINLEPADLGLSPQFTFSFVDSTSVEPLTPTSRRSFGVFVDAGQPLTSTIITLTTLDADGSSLDSYSANIAEIGLLPDGFVGVVSDRPFYGVLFQSNGDDASIADGIDRVLLGERKIAAVPEPSTFFLLGTGVAGLMLARRRFR